MKAKILIASILAVMLWFVPGLAEQYMDIEVGGKYYLEGSDVCDDCDKSEFLGTATLGLEEDLNENARIKYRAMLRLDTMDLSEGVLGNFDPNHDRKRPYAYIDEAYLEFSPGASSLWMGSRRPEPGVLDELGVVGPAPKDFTELSRPEDFGIPGAGLKFGLQNGLFFSAGAYLNVRSWMPYNGPWRPKSLGGIGIEELEGQGIDILYHGIVGYSTMHMDVEFHGMVGERDTPTFKATGPLSVRPIYPKYNGLGAAIALDLPWELGIKSEITRINQGAGLDDYVQISSRLERRFSPFIEDGNFLHIAMQYFGEEIIEEGNDMFQRTYDPKRLIKRGYGGKIELGIDDGFLTISCKGIYDNKDFGYIVQPELSFQVADDVRLKIYSDIVGGHEESALGQYGDNDMVASLIIIRF